MSGRSRVSVTQTTLSSAKNGSLTSWKTISSVLTKNPSEFIASKAVWNSARAFLDSQAVPDATDSEAAFNTERVLATHECLRAVHLGLQCLRAVMATSSATKSTLATALTHDIVNSWSTVLWKWFLHWSAFGSPSNVTVSSTALSSLDPLPVKLVIKLVAEINHIVGFVNRILASPPNHTIFLTKLWLEAVTFDDIECLRIAPSLVMELERSKKGYLPGFQRVYNEVLGSTRAERVRSVIKAMDVFLRSPIREQHWSDLFCIRANIGLITAFIEVSDSDRDDRIGFLRAGVVPRLLGLISQCLRIPTAYGNEFELESKSTILIDCGIALERFHLGEDGHIQIFNQLPWVVELAENQALIIVFKVAAFVEFEVSRIGPQMTDQVRHQLDEVMQRFWKYIDWLLLSMDFGSRALYRAVSKSLRRLETMGADPAHSDWLAKSVEILAAMQRFRESWRTSMQWIEYLLGGHRLYLREMCSSCMNPECDYNNSPIPQGLAKWCTGCLSAVYCSCDCQRLHRKSHRKSCSKIPEDLLPLEILSWKDVKFRESVKESDPVEAKLLKKHLHWIANSGCSGSKTDVGDSRCGCENPGDEQDAEV